MGQSEAEKRIVDGRAWHDFCDALKAAGDSVLRPSTPGSHPTELDICNRYEDCTSLVTTLTVSPG